MARTNRRFLPNLPQLLLLRGNNRQTIFHDEQDFRAFSGWLNDTAGVHRCEIHAYVLMPDHLHLLATPWYETSLPRLMQSLGRRYVRYFNDRYRRSGTLWEGRYRATLVDSQAFLLDCIRYIEENPCRSGLSERPQEYPWSSARAHLSGGADHILTEHMLFQGLANSREERGQRFAEYCAKPFDEQRLAAIRYAGHTGWPLGTDRFKDELEHFAAWRARPQPRGRPRKNP